VTYGIRTVAPRANPANPAAAPGGAVPRQVFDGEPRPYAAGPRAVQRVIVDRPSARRQRVRPWLVSVKAAMLSPTSSQRSPRVCLVATALAVRVNRRAGSAGRSRLRMREIRPFAVRYVQYGNGRASSISV